MSKQTASPGRHSEKQGGKLLPVLCHILGTLLLLAVIVTFLPLTVPQWLGYEVYHVESPSMSPQLPQGSVIYVQIAKAEEIAAGDVIAFRSGDGVVVHRVVQNRVVEGQFITKGDANTTEDIEPVPYAALVGRTVFHVPVLGALLSVYSSTVGKLYALLVAGCGLLLNLLAHRIRARRYARLKACVTASLLQTTRSEEASSPSLSFRPSEASGEIRPLPSCHSERSEEASSPSLSFRPSEASGEIRPLPSCHSERSEESQTASDSSVAALPQNDKTRGNDKTPENSKTWENDKAKTLPRTRRRRWLVVVVIVLALAFVGSGVTILVLNGRYRVGRERYQQAAARYTFRPSAASDPGVPAADADAPDAPDDAAQIPAERPPIGVNFEALQQSNPDIIGWIYCPDTAINYPVLRGEDNDVYLHRSFDREYCYSGSIFVEAANRADFTDDNTVIYGHNMLDGSMFHCLADWKDQSFYEAHPVIWLLTPEQNYRIELFAGYTTGARGDAYQLRLPTEAQRTQYLNAALAQSDFQSDYRPATDGRWVLLSTCAYDFNEARYVLHGELVPIP